MINGKRVLALIPARGGSKGLPGKNIRSLCDKPLLGWPVQAARDSRYVDAVIVSTDDENIKQVALEQGAEVPFLRPDVLAGDEAKSADVIVHALEFLQAHGRCYSYIILLEPTSPLTEASDIDTAIESLESQRVYADSIVGVSKVENTHPVFDVIIKPDKLIAPYIGDFSAAGRRQDIQELYFLEGSLYISDVTVFLKKKTFYHNRTLPYIVPKWKSFEIDQMVDFICVEAIMKQRQLLKREGD